jgi:hypothetical protein
MCLLLVAFGNERSGQEDTRIGVMKVALSGGMEPEMPGRCLRRSEDRINGILSNAFAGRQLGSPLLSYSFIGSSKDLLSSKKRKNSRRRTIWMALA